jgi:hypothetical protein
MILRAPYATRLRSEPWRGLIVSRLIVILSKRLLRSEGSGRAVRMPRVLCEALKRTFGAHPL